MAKRPRDFNQLAKLVVDIASGEVEDMVSLKMKTPNAIRGRSGGLRGGTERAKSLTPDVRADIARVAANVRWKKG